MAKAKAKAKAPAKAPAKPAPAATERSDALVVISSIEANPANRSDGTVAYQASKGQLDELRALIEAI